MPKLDHPSVPRPNVAPPRARARTRSSDACSSRAPGPTGRCTARRSGCALDTRDLGLATQLSFGTVQRVSTLDHVIERLARRPPAKLDAPVLAALRLGVFQLTFLDRIPAHAAVGESVELAKADAPKRRRARQRRAAPRGQGGAAAGRRAPGVHAEGGRAEVLAPRVDRAPVVGDLRRPPTANALMAANNEPAEASLRANTLRTTAEALAARLPAHTVPELPEALVLDEPFDTFASPEWEQGLLMPQSRAAMSVARALAPEPGERVLDLCAAPGGKTTHLAALMGDEGEIVAVEQHAGRAEALRRTAQRMGASIVEVHTADATQPQPGEFDRVLVDPPCSDLGTLASRPDARWRKAGRPEALARLQLDILGAGARALRRGGTLVYSTCTISPNRERARRGSLPGRS